MAQKETDTKHCNMYKSFDNWWDYSAMIRITAGKNKHQYSAIH